MGRDFVNSSKNIGRTGRHTTGSRRFVSVGSRRHFVNIFLVFIGSVFLIAVMVIAFNGLRTKAGSDTCDVATYKYYTSIEIQKDDTIWDLASDYIDGHYESREAYIEEVVSINSLDDADDIISGQHLIMPYYSSEYK